MPKAAHAVQLLEQYVGRMVLLESADGHGRLEPLAGHHLRAGSDAVGHTSRQQAVQSRLHFAKIVVRVAQLRLVDQRHRPQRRRALASPVKNLKIHNEIEKRKLSKANRSTLRDQWKTTIQSRKGLL